MQVDDWVDNLKNMMLGKHSTQYDQASKFYEDMMKLNKGMKPVVVGHSKGGNLAAYIASKYGNCTAYLFNPMPLHKDLVNLENLKTCKIKTRVAENDFIASLLSLFFYYSLLSLISDLKIKKSSDLVQCQKWLSELERGFKANEKDLMTLLDKLAI